MTESIEQATRSHVFAVLASLALLALAILGGQAGAAPPPAEEPVSPQAAALLSQNYTGQFVTGATIYKQRCASCHDDGLGRAPQLFVLQQMTPGAIHNSLTSGAMRAQAAGLSAQDKADVAQYLADRKLGTARTSRIALCRAPRARFDRGEPPVFAGWGLDPSNSHAIPTALAGIDRRNIGRLKLKWAFGFEGATRARSQPSLAGGAIYVGSSNGRVYALDRQTGCVRWAFEAVAEVRTMVLVEPWQAGDHRARPLAWFGDTVGNFYAVEAFTGKLVWKVRADAHPGATLTATPALWNGTLYLGISSTEEGSAGYPNYQCCTFRGSLLALDAATGREKWRTWLTGVPVAQGTTAAGVARFGPSGVAVWNTPAIDAKRNQLTIGTGDDYTKPDSRYVDSVLALDLASGHVKWQFQALASDAWNAACVMRAVSKNCPEGDGPDFDIGAGTVLTKDANGRELVLAGDKSGTTYALDPGTGKLVWKTRIGRGGVTGGINFSLAVDGGRVFVPISDMPDGRTYEMPAAPGLYALDVTTGARLWGGTASDASCTKRANCHSGYGGTVTATPELVFAGADDAHLRIFDAANGKLLWDEDTMRDYPTVNRVPARGGAIGGASAPVAYKGLLIANSGYGYAGKMPGNVLLVYEVK